MCPSLKSVSSSWKNGSDNALSSFSGDLERLQEELRAELSEEEFGHLEDVRAEVEREYLKEQKRSFALAGVLLFLGAMVVILLLSYELSDNVRLILGVVSILFILFCFWLMPGLRKRQLRSRIGDVEAISTRDRLKRYAWLQIDKEKLVGSQLIFPDIGFTDSVQGVAELKGIIQQALVPEDMNRLPGARLEASKEYFLEKIA